MAKRIAWVFPHQLFYDHPALADAEEVWLIEEPLFFTQYNFHQHKLMLHRATMRMYQDVLEAHGYAVKYKEVPHSQTEALMRAVGKSEVHLCDVTDYLLERRIRRYAQKYNVPLVVHESPNFLLTKKEVDAYFDGSRRFFMHDFYVHHRKKSGVLIDALGKPVGGKWTFDAENRQKMPAGVKVPALPTLPSNEYVEEAAQYMQKHFPNNYGSTEGFVYPVTYEESRDWLMRFCEERFANYGVYQDAIVKDGTFLFHAVLTPMLNIGLLSPHEVLHTALEVGLRNDVPMNSVEGFVRQVMGWREYIRAVYVQKGVEERTKNYWNHTRRIPKSFWEGTTGIAPIDAMVKRTTKHAYAHHIERLMIAGNFMLLCGFDPDEVHRWFMELFIDAYDWVMVPNVYGMALFADGGIMSTKPYISGSNYVLKMSDYAKGPWCEVWDGLFWKFIHDHRDFFSANFRLSMMVKTLDKMQPAKRAYLFEKAEKYLSALDATV